MMMRLSLLGIAAVLAALGFVVTNGFAQDTKHWYCSMCRDDGSTLVVHGHRRTGRTW